MTGKIEWQIGVPDANTGRMTRDDTYHGGRFFEAIGTGFETLERESEVISADVLDAWFDPAPQVLEKVREFLPFLLRTSPPIYAEGLVDAIARARGLHESSIVTGAGSSDLLFTCLPRLLGAGEHALILDPMYGEYRHLLENVIGAVVIRHRLTAEQNFRVDAAGLLEEIKQKRPQVACIVNPNSPTGQFSPKLDLLRLVHQVPRETLLLIDETYIDYVGSSESFEREAEWIPNLMIVKSMSKVYALSGARAAYLVTRADRARALARWMPPWAISLPAQVAAVEALNCEDYYRHRYEETRLLRERLIRDLRSLPGIHVFSSQANFALIELYNHCADEVSRRLRRHGIYVRNCDDMSEQFGNRFLRIAVKSSRQNECIVSALRESMTVKSSCRSDLA